MMFEFVNSTEINGKPYDEFGGKLITDEVWEAESKLKYWKNPEVSIIRMKMFMLLKIPSYLLLEMFLTYII